MSLRRDYSSAHMVWWSRAYIGDFTIELPVEAQLRVAAEDIWAEINHRFLYKINASQTWSYDYQADYSRTEDISSRLRTKINELTPLIKEFYDAYESTIASSQIFDAPQRHDYHFSIVLALLLAMGGPGQDLVNSGITEDLTQYHSVITELRKAAEVPNAAGRQAIVKAISIIHGVITKIDQVPSRQRARRNKAVQLLADERRALLELEILRLEAIAALYFNARVTNEEQGIDTKYHDQVTDPEAYKETLLSVYGRFCTYLERPVAMRPECVIMFFKYLLATKLDPEQIDIAELARDNLVSSYELLRAGKDRTLPTYSIYRVLLPRAIADELTKDVKKTLAKIGEGNRHLPNLNVLRRTLEEKLIDALKYAMRAGDEHVSELNNPRRGDMLFGASPEEATLELTKILDIFDIYIKNFDNLSIDDKLRKRMLRPERANLCTCVNKLMKTVINLDADLESRAQALLEELDGNPNHHSERNNDDSDRTSIF